MSPMPLRSVPPALRPSDVVAGLTLLFLLALTLFHLLT